MSEVTLESLKQEIEALREEINALKAQRNPETAPVNPKHLAIIGAVVAAIMGNKAKVRYVRTTDSFNRTWSQDGRGQPHSPENQTLTTKRR